MRGPLPRVPRRRLPVRQQLLQFVSADVPARGLLEIQRVASQGWHDDATPLPFVVFAEFARAPMWSSGASIFLKRAKPRQPRPPFGS